MSDYLVVIRSGLKSAACARVMDKSRMTIYRAKNLESDASFGDLKLDPIERDKLHKQMPLFTKFIALLPTKSGNLFYADVSICHVNMSSLNY